jgi:hypothetical protein
MRAVLWSAIVCSMVAWAWSSLRGGRLSDRQFLAFSAGLMAGQAAGSIEAFSTGSYGTAVSQLYFFLFTIWGAVRRVERIRSHVGRPASQVQASAAPPAHGYPLTGGSTG